MDLYVIAIAVLDRPDGDQDGQNQHGRSHTQQIHTAANRHADGRHRPQARRRVQPLDHFSAHHDRAGPEKADAGDNLDRKSTRLNSSH